MVKLKTVLVLGAGASWDFGFPTGSELVRQILNSLDNSEKTSFKLFMEACNQVCSGEDYSRAGHFHSILQKAKPLSIDAWLAHNPTYIKIGKIAIAIALLRCEQRADLRSAVKGDWYQLLFDRLNCPFEDFEENEISIV